MHEAILGTLFYPPQFFVIAVDLSHLYDALDDSIHRV